MTALFFFYIIRMSGHFSKIMSFLHRPFFYRTIQFQIGSIGALLVQAVAGVVLARLLGPHEFGRYAIVMSLAAMGSVFLGAGAADAMAPVLSRARHSGDDAGLRNALLFLGKFVTVTAGIVFILGLVMPILAGYFYGDRMLGWYSFAVLAASIVSTLLLVPTQLGFQVFGQIRNLSMLTFADQAIRQGLVGGLVVSGLGVLGASSGHLFGAFIVMMLSAFFWKRMRVRWPLIPSINSLLCQYPDDGRQYIKPTLWVLADRNLAMFYGAAPVALAALFLTTTDVSYFKIALGWIMLALAVLSPISVLLNTELARVQVQQPQRLRMHFFRVTSLAVGVSSLLTGVAALIARPVFQVLYGAEYAAAAPLVYWLVPFGALFGLGVALGPMWRAVDRVRVSIVINLCVLGIGVPCALLAMRQWGALGAIAMVTVWYTASHGISLWYLSRYLKIRHVASSAQTV